MKPALVALLVALVALASVGVVLASAGDAPLTQMAQEEAEMEFASIAAFTGVHVDPAGGAAYVTWNNGIMRVPPVLTDSQKFISVTTKRKINANPVDQFDPCDAGIAPDPTVYNCTGADGYLGTSNALYFETDNYATDLKLPWIKGSRVFALGSNSLGYSLIQFDKLTFSVLDSTYNRIQSANLRGAVKVFYDRDDSASGFTYIVTNADSGNARIIRMANNAYSNVANWKYAEMVDTAIADAAWNTDKSAFFFVGTAAGVNGVWRFGNNDALFTSGALLTPTITATNATTCADTGRTIIFDEDTTPLSKPSRRGNRVYVGCTGTIAPTGVITKTGSIEAYDANTLARVNSTALQSLDGLFTTMISDPATGVIYIGTQGAAADSGTYSQIIQYNTIDDAREGRVGTSYAVAINAMALNPYRTVPSGQQRAGAPTFYTVGGNSVSKNAAVSRWSAVQGCTDNCGEFAFPVRGSCLRRECTCTNFNDNGPDGSNTTLTWLGPWCATLTCPFDCNGRGTCANKTCVCDRDVYTVTPDKPCLAPRCPNDCMGRGTCNRNSTGYPIDCTCNPGWTNDDCSLKTYFPCELLSNNCTGCVDNPGCIWCASSRLCYPGDRNGPFATVKEFECRSWFHGSCPSVAIDIVNYIMTAILGICLLISLLSGTIIDTASEDPERRTEWYLFQRAGKIWSMIFQLQMVAIAGLINISFPTSFVAFIRYWNWILLSWGFPWNHSKGAVDGWADSSVQTGRSTKSVDQYLTYWKADTHSIFFTWLLWFGVVLGFCLVFYVFVLLFAAIRKGRAGFLATTRPVFILLRMLELGHLGLCVLGPLSILKGGNSAIVGGIFWAVFGVLLPIGLYVWLGFIKEKKALFKPNFAASCYPYYGAFDFRFRAFIVAPWVRRILLGIFIGFIGTSNPLGQLIPIAVINLVWLLFVIVQRNMYSDYLQRYLEIILAILNFIAFLFLFGFYGSPSSGVVNTMGIIFLVLQFLGVAISACFFIISWLQLNQVYSLGQCFKFCTCRKVD
jgi:hypothetical protein